MRAVVYDRYGPPEVLRLEDVERPVPKDDEILVRVVATTVNRTDTGLRGAEYFITRLFTGLRRPRQRILGMEIAGVVEGVGSAVTEFAVGDEVFGVKTFGAHAEYVCLRASGPVARKPSGASFEEAAAAIDGAALALACLRKAGLGAGQSILVYGASGAVGTAGVQLAASFGATVTAVTNTKNMELARSLGATEVIDYTQEDFTRHGRTYDVVFDAVGKTSFWRCRRLLKRRGFFVDTDPGFMWHLFPLALITRWVGSRKAGLGITKYSKQDVLLLKELMEAGKYRPVIDRVYPLEQVVEATRYVEAGQKTGNVVLMVGAGTESGDRGPGKDVSIDPSR
jgi:NADPH:quinone reductase-like Zn-dependent oxidoreductase